MSQVTGTKVKEFSLREYFHKNLQVLKLIGLWPEKSYVSNQLYLLYTLILIGCFSTAMSLSFLTFLITSPNILEDFIETGYFLASVMSTVKAVFLMYHYDMFNVLLDGEVHTRLNVRLTEKQNQILCDTVGIWRMIQLVYTYIPALLALNFCATPLLLKIPYGLPIKSWYPFDYKKPIIYELVFAHQGISALIDVYVYMNGGIFTIGFLSYIAAECEVLADMLRNLNTNSSSQGATIDTEELKICIIYHKEIVQYSRLVESYFSKYLLLQFICTGIITTGLMTAISEKDNLDGKFIFLIFMQLSIWVDLYVYCWYGNDMTEKSMKIPTAAFESNWDTASKAFKKDLVIFICNTQKPIKMYAVNLFELSLNTFIGVLRTSYSYYTLLRGLSSDE